MLSLHISWDIVDHDRKSTNQYDLLANDVHDPLCN